LLLGDLPVAVAALEFVGLDARRLIGIGIATAGQQAGRDIGGDGAAVGQLQ
jgi:hypothetical protein